MIAAGGRRMIENVASMADNRSDDVDVYVDICVEDVVACVIYGYG